MYITVNVILSEGPDMSVGRRIPELRSGYVKTQALVEHSALPPRDPSLPAGIRIFLALDDVFHRSKYARPYRTLLILFRLMRTVRSGGLRARNAGPPPHLARAIAPAKNLVWRYEKLSMICWRSYKLSSQLLEKQHNFIFGPAGACASAF